SAREAESESDARQTGTATATAAAGVLSLTNADLGATQIELAARIAGPPDVEEASAPPDAAATVEPERWGTPTPVADEVWIGSDAPTDRAAAADPPLDFSACMERAIRGEVAFVPARRVCEVLFPETASSEVE
ncbi:MAG: hypothetical protein AAGC67_21390, partial [Myxococcota bacterium]